MKVLLDNLQSKEVWGAIVQALATIVAVCLAYRFALRQMRQQAHIQVQQDWCIRRANALHSAWGLLQYLTETENDMALIRWEHRKTESGGRTPDRQYFLHIGRAQRFVFEDLPKAFYGAGAGLHWSPSIKAQFFECRSILYGVLLKQKAAHAPTQGSVVLPWLPVQTPEMARRLRELYTALHAQLRQQLKEAYAPAKD